MKHTRYSAEILAVGVIGGIMVQAVMAPPVRAADLRAGQLSERVVPRTHVSIQKGRWFLNDAVTYRGTQAEGLLLNVRMVNAVFEDRNRPDFDPNSNTDEFIAQIPGYVAHGVRAFTICLQGGSCGYEGALNSAFQPDGSLRDSYLRRVRRVIEACDRSGAIVILGCYYQRQDQVLADEAAVRAGVVNVAKWIERSGFANVVLEIANEFDHSGFNHRLLKTPEGMAGLIALAKRTSPALLGVGQRSRSWALARRSRPGKRFPADSLQLHAGQQHPRVHRGPEKVRQAHRLQ